MDKKIKFDTTLLTKSVEKKGMSLGEFYKKASEMTGVNAYTIRGHVVGRARPSKAELEAFAKITGLTVKQIAAVYEKEDKNASKKRAATTSLALNNKVFNYEALMDAVNKSGLSRNRICNILGLSSASFVTWEKSVKGPNATTVARLCTLLDIKPEQLYKESAEPEKVAEKEKDTVTPPDCSKEFEEESLKKIDTLDIHQVFNIINDNIIALSHNLNLMYARLSSEISQVRKEGHDDSAHLLDQMQKMQDFLKEMSAKSPEAKISEPSARKDRPVMIITPEVIKGNSTEPVASVKGSKKEIANLVKGYKSEDDFNTYRAKINRMVGLINEETGDTHKQTLHKFYEEMNHVYGVVYDQLKKEYYNKYQRKDNGTTELIYENELFREIFYHLIATKLDEVYAKVAK